MKKRTRIFVVAIDEDPVPGAFDKDRIHYDIKCLLTQTIPHYNPRVVSIDTITRDSNFMDNVAVEYELPSEIKMVFAYEAERPRGEE